MDYHDGRTKKSRLSYAPSFGMPQSAFQRQTTHFPEYWFFQERRLDSSHHNWILACFEANAEWTRAGCTRGYILFVLSVCFLVPLVMWTLESSTGPRTTTTAEWMICAFWSWRLQGCYAGTKEDRLLRTCPGFCTCWCMSPISSFDGTPLEICGVFSMSGTNTIVIIS